MWISIGPLIIRKKKTFTWPLTIPQNSIVCTNRRRWHARFLASGRSLSGRGAFFGLYALGPVLPAGKA